MQKRDYHLRKCQLNRFGYKRSAEEKVIIDDNGRIRVFYDKRRGEENLPKIKNINPIKGLFIEPLFDFTGIPLDASIKPVAMVYHHLVGLPLPVFDMKGTIFEETLIYFNVFPSYRGPVPLNRTIEGRNLLNQVELIALNKRHSVKIKKAIPEKIELLISDDSRKSAIYCLYFDVSSHPLFRVMLLTDDTITASDILSVYLQNLNIK
jgi:hypothetical protein